MLKINNLDIDSLVDRLYTELYDKRKIIIYHHKEGTVMYAEFDETLVTGNETIDSQHKELIDKINELVRSCETSVELSTAVKTLNYLADYTDFHFSAEEKLQEEIEYPGIEEHKKQHKEFIQTIEDLHDMLVEEEGPTKEFSEKVNEKVIEWLYKHIKGFDRSVAEYKNLRSNSKLI